MAREALAAKADTDAGNLRGLIVGWQEIDPEGEGKTAARVVNTLAEADKASYPALREVLADLFDLRKASCRQAGSWATSSTNGRVGMSAECALTAALSTAVVRLGLSGRWAGAVTLVTLRPNHTADHTPRCPTRGGKGRLLVTPVTLVDAVLPTFAGVRDTDDVCVLGERQNGVTRVTRVTTTGTTADGPPSSSSTDTAGLETSGRAW